MRALHERLERGSQTGVVSEVWRRAEPFVWSQKRFEHDGNYVFRIVPSKIAEVSLEPHSELPGRVPPDTAAYGALSPPLAEQYPGAPRLATRAERSSGAFQRGGGYERSGTLFKVHSFRKHKEHFIDYCLITKTWPSDGVGSPPWNPFGISLAGSPGLLRPAKPCAPPLQHSATGGRALERGSFRKFVTFCKIF